MERFSTNLNRRWLWWLVALLLIVAAAGALRLHTDAATEKLLANRSGSYESQQRFIHSYPLEQQQIQAVVRGPLLDSTSLAQLLNWEAALLADPFVTEVYSFFSDPRARRKMDSPEPLKQYLDGNLTLRSAFVSEDYQAGILAIALSDTAREDAVELSRTLIRLQQIMQQESTDLSIEFTGLPVLSDALHNVLSRDVWRYIGIAAVAALLAAWLYFGRLSVVLVTLAAPLLGTALLYGVMGWFGIRINLLNQLVGVLVFIVAYTDSLFLCRHALHRFLEDMPIAQTIKDTYYKIGPACLTTSVTTAIGFGCLAVSSSKPLFEVALLGVFSVVLTFVVVMLFLPLTVSMLAKAGEVEPHEKLLNRLLASGNKKLTNTKSPMIVFAVFILVVVGVSTQLNSTYTPGENLPADSQFRQSMLRADRDLNGLLPLHVLVEWEQPVDFKVGRRMTSTLYQLQAALDEKTNLQWSSIANVLSGIPGLRVKDKLAAIPEVAVRRLFDRDNATALLSSRTRYADSEQLGQSIKALQAEIANLNTSRSDVRLSLVGTVPLAIFAGDRILRDLWSSLSLAFLAILVAVTLAFRSLTRAFLCLLPSMGAVLSVAAYLVLVGEPVRFVTMMVFSVSLGVVVDHSIHFGFHVTRRENSGTSLFGSIQDAVKKIGSTAILAQLVLVSGFSTLYVSNTPTVSQLGVLAVIALMVGLCLNLLLLPLLLQMDRKTPKVL